MGLLALGMYIEVLIKSVQQHAKVVKVQACRLWA
jgi:hypothetical protein